MSKLKAINENMHKSTESRKNTLLCAGIFLAVIVVYHLMIREYYGDSVNSFSYLLKDKSLIQVLRERYEGWSSRVLIEAALILLSNNMHTVLWSIINIVMYMILLISLMKLTYFRHNVLVTFMMLLYPVIEMASAGWMPTFVNYMWPLSMSVFALISLQKMYDNEKINPLFGVLFLLAEIFGTNFETSGVFYFILILYFVIAMIAHKKFTVRRVIYTIVESIICIFNIFFALTCPGNWARRTHEITNWMKDFPTLTSVDKFVLGVNSTFSLLIDSNILFLFFTIILFLTALMRKNRPQWLVYVSALPMMATVIRNILKPISSAYLSQFTSLFDNVTSTKVDAMNYDIPSSYLPFVYYAIIIVSVLAVYLYSFDSVWTSLLMIFVFAGGLITRIAMGFSPTLYASSNRTFIFLDCALIWLTIKDYDSYHRDINDNVSLMKVGTMLCPLIAFVFFISNIVAICTRY